MKFIDTRGMKARIWPIVNQIWSLSLMHSLYWFFIFTNTTAYHWADVSCCTPCQVHVSLTFTNPEIIDLELQPKFDCKFLHQRGKFHNLRPNGHNYDEKVSFTLSLTNPYLEVYGLIECSLSL